VVSTDRSQARCSTTFNTARCSTTCGCGTCRTADASREQNLLGAVPPSSLLSPTARRPKWSRL